MENNGISNKQEYEYKEEFEAHNKRELERLPKEIWQLIASWLDIREITIFSSTCSFFYELLNREDLFKSLCFRDFVGVPSLETTWKALYKDLACLRVVSIFQNGKHQMTIDPKFFDNERVIQVISGRGVCAALTNQGNVWTFSQTHSPTDFGYCGEVAFGRSGPAWPPAKVSLPSKVVKIGLATGDGYHFGSLTEEGDLYTWGRGNSGQLGTGRTAERSVPQQVQFPPNVKISNFGFGWCHSAAVTSKGEVYMWGRGSTQASGSDQLGLGSTSDKLNPVKLPFFDNKPVLECAAGDCHTIFLTESGEVYSLGRNDHGECGLGNTTNPVVPTLVNFNGKKVVKVCCGEFTSAALTSEGEVYFWGDGVLTPKLNFDGKKHKAIGCTRSTLAAVDEHGNLEFGGKRFVKVREIGIGYSHALILCPNLTSNSK